MITLQIRHEDEVVGWFETMIPPEALGDRLTICDIEETMEVPLRSYYKQLAFSELYHMPARDQNALIRRIQEAYDIPPYAEMVLDEARPAWIFRWKAALIDLDQYEKLFDLESFQPA